MVVMVMKFKKLLTICVVLIFIVFCCIYTYQKKTNISLAYDDFNKTNIQKETSMEETATVNNIASYISKDTKLDIIEVSDYIKEITPKYDVSNYELDENEILELERQRKNGIEVSEEAFKQDKVGQDIMKETAKHFNVSLEELLKFLSDTGKQ